MRFFALLSLLTVATFMEAQLPIRNYIYFNLDTIRILFAEEGLGFDEYSDTYSDSYGYDYDLEEEPVYYEDYGVEEEGVKNEEMAIAPVAEEVQEDTLEEEFLAGEIYLEVYSSEPFGYSGNTATFYLRNDSCYLVQYNWYDDEFVLESIRNVMEQREDFSPCFDMKDCWVQQKPGEETLYYWNLFEKYEGDDSWKVLRIEGEKAFEENRWWYQFSEGKN